MLSILSLVLIFIENSLPVNGIILITSLPFISYNARKEGSIFYFFVAYLLMSLQTDRYFYNFIVILIYSILNMLLLSYIEYNKKTIFYMLLIQISFYFLMSYRFISIKYIFINICGFIIWNYIYTKNIENKGK